MKLKGRVALITGTSPNICGGIAIGMAEAGALVVCVDVQPDMLLAARGLGLASVLTTRPRRGFEHEIKQKLGIPDNVDTAALIPLGYPAEGRRYGPTNTPACRGGDVRRDMGSALGGSVRVDRSACGQQGGTRLATMSETQIRGADR